MLITPHLVIAGPDPVISSDRLHSVVGDCRVKPGNDGVFWRSDVDWAGEKSAMLITPHFVITGLDPVISTDRSHSSDEDCRVEPGNDGVYGVVPRVQLESVRH